MADLVTGYHIMIADLHHPQNFGLDGTYNIHTQDLEVLMALVARLQSRLHDVRLFNDVRTGILGRLWVSLFFQPGEGAMARFMEFGLIFPMVTACLLMSLIQYVFVKMKRTAIFSSHGFDQLKISKIITLEILKSSAWGIGMAYLGTVFYVTASDRLVLLGQLSTYFLIITLILGLVYLLLVNILTALMLKASSIAIAVKGQKSRLKVGRFNHFIKALFSIGFLLTLHLMMTNLQYLRPRLAATTYWTQAENVYRIIVNGHTFLTDDTRYDEQKIAFYHDLVAYHDGFMMDSGRILWMDGWENDDDWGPPSGDLDLNERIMIDPSFLKLNPIYDFDGVPVYERLMFDDYVLDVLLPERWMMDEAELYDDFLDMAIGWGQWSENRGETLTQDMSLNVIHVPDGQYYFSFDRQIRVEDGNRVRDPVVLVYDGRITDAFWIPPAVSHSVYFVAQTHQPFSEIEALVYAHGLGSEIQRVEAIYDQNVREISAMETHHQRLIVLKALLFAANVAVAYNLIANYFERYKFEIFLKSTFGWHIFKRHQVFLTTYLIYSLILMMVLSSMLGWYLVLVGVGILTLDIMTLLFFEQRLIKKSFSEIMKGER